MTIVEALKAKKIHRIEVGSRWLIFDTSNVEIYNNNYMVRKDDGNAIGKLLCITQDEEEAVKWLMGEE